VDVAVDPATEIDRIGEILRAPLFDFLLRR